MYDHCQVKVMMMVMMIILMMMMLLQVGPGDDYMLTVGGFNDGKSTLGDSMRRSINSTWNSNGMKFTTR